EGNIASTRTTEGELLQTTYRLESGTAQVLLQAVADDLADDGYKQLFECEDSACGATFTRASPGYRQAPDQFDVANGTQYYRAYRKPGTLGGRYVAVQVAQGGTDAPLAIQVDVLQAEPRVVGAITVNAAEMAHK